MSRSLDGHSLFSCYKKFRLPGKEETDSPMKGGTMKIDSESDREHMTHLISQGFAVERTKARIYGFTCSDRLMINLVNSFDPVRVGLHHAAVV